MLASAVLVCEGGSGVRVDGSGVGVGGFGVNVGGSGVRLGGSGVSEWGGNNGAMEQNNISGVNKENVCGEG